MKSNKIISNKIRPNKIRPNKIFLASAFIAFSFGCSSSSGPSDSGGCRAANTSCSINSGPVSIPTSNTATVPVYIADPSTTGSSSYVNEPLVSVTLCSPNHTLGSQCQTISNILLDTGSYGLRVFGSAINSNVQLVQQTVSISGETTNLAECAEFGSGADWGSIQNGDVKLGNQTATNIPIQVININFGTIPSSCSALCPDTDPCTAGYNGILGVGLFAQDCGALCANYNSDADNPGIYFGCDGSGCYDAYDGACGSDGVCVVEVPTNKQVVNPVASFSAGHNNGVGLTLPSVGSSGASAITNGSLVLGVSSPTVNYVYQADSSGMTDGDGPDFTTTFEGTTYGGSSSDPSDTKDPELAFLDSGSNGIFFPSGLTTCSDSPYYCPGSTQSLSAQNSSFSGGSTVSASFSAANADSLFGTGNSAFSNLCAPSSGEFDWGLPYFYGKTIYFGLSGTTATINASSATGPYWAY